jgi:hypothetical protein
VDAAVSLDNVTHFSNIEVQRRFFEWSLHLTFLEDAQISAFACGGAVRILAGKLCEFLGRAIDLGLITLEDFDGLLLGTSDIGLWAPSAMVRWFIPKATRNQSHLSPARGTPAIAMLHEKVARSHALILGGASEVL